MTLFNTSSVRALARTLTDRVLAFMAVAPLWSLPAQRIIQQFHAAGALTRPTAQPFHVRSHVEEDAFLELLRLAVIREPAPGRYYLDETVLHELWAQGLLPRW